MAHDRAAEPDGNAPDQCERLARWLYIYRYGLTGIAAQNWDEGWCETKDHYRLDAAHLLSILRGDA